MPYLLLVDDDTEFCSLLERYFRTEGFDVVLAHDGEKGAELALANDFDLIILDIMLPGQSGLEVLRKLRSAPKRTPVLMLTALADDSDSLVGFEHGADDYLGKPCNLKVLLARARALLRRSESASQSDKRGLFKIGDLTMEVGSRSVKCNDTALSLTVIEFSILEVLLRSAGQVVPKSELSIKVLHRALGRFDRSLDTHISNLRQKTGPLPDGEERIKTIRGVGYQYTVN